jgi:hypothetical protein
MVADEVGVRGERRPVNHVNIEGGKKRLSVLSVQTIKHALEKADVEFPKD